MRFLKSSIPLSLLSSASFAFPSFAPLYRHQFALQLSISSYSLPGSDPDRPSKVNQDSFFHHELDDGKTVAFGVMDGHGLKGHLLTRFLSHEFPSILNECFLSVDHVPNADLQDYQARLRDIGKDNDGVHYSHPLCRAFHMAQWSAMQNPNVPAGRSGSTCIVGVIMNGTRLELGHVGDSRAILIDSNNAIIPLTLETITKLMTLESTRVKTGEGRVDAFGNVFYGPQGIAMTRSLGNSVMLRAGILPTPILMEQTVLNEGSTLVLATDGVWDVLSNEQVKDVVMRSVNHDFQDSGRFLAEAAKRAWIGDLPIEGKVDDITCMIIRI